VNFALKAGANVIRFLYAPNFCGRFFQKKQQSFINLLEINIQKNTRTE